MANLGFQLLGFTLALFGWLGVIASTAMPEWKRSAYGSGSIITAISIYEGLWMSCASQSTGQIQCKIYDSLLNLDGSLQAARALMVLSAVLCFIGICIAIVGMKCTRMMSDDEVKKGRVAIVSGVIFMIGGLSCLIAVSYYTQRIISAFYDLYTPVQSRYEIGSAVFVGFAGSLLVILGGSFLCCSCTSTPRSVKPRSRPVNPSSGVPRSNKEFV
uniref:claudin-1-like n=1 Tax=Myxine glutinosa TaxID=7769 RepID=UPI00358F2285